MKFPSISLPRIFSDSQEYLELEKEYEDGIERALINGSPRSPKKTYYRSFIISSFFNFILTLLLLTVFFFNIPAPWSRKDGKEVIRASSSFSPIIDKIPITTSLKIVNGSFFSETNPPDIFRALPTAEVDKAWQAISHPTWITISKADVLSLSKDPNTLVSAPMSWNLGPDRYVAMLDLNHQLHCLNLLRKLAFNPVHPSGPRADFQSEHWMHCVHILYQNIMCTGSTEVITYNWRETQRFPVPDFDVPKMCRNSEALLDFQEREKVRDSGLKRDEMVRPEGAVVLPLPPRLKAFLEAHDDDDKQK